MSLEFPKDVISQKKESSLERRKEEDALEKGEIIGFKRMETGGDNEAYFVVLSDGTEAIFKPGAGEMDGAMESIKAGTYYKRERAAYLVDRALDLKMVPTTVIREINGESGALQKFIQDAKNLSKLSAEELKECDPDLIGLRIFDYIIWNSDRHDDNLLGKDGKIYAIDNGLTFAEEELPRYYGKYEGKTVPPDLIDKIKRLASDSAKKENLRSDLGKLLSEEEVNGCMDRIGKIAG